MRRIAATAAWVLLFAVSVPPMAAAGEVRDDRAAQHLRDTVADSMRSLGAPSGVVEAVLLDEEDRSVPYLRPVGDLDGDGNRDVVSVGYTESATGSDLVLTGRRGKDGAVLFTHTRPGEGWDVIVPTTLDSGEGVLLVRFLGALGGLASGRARGEDPWYGWSDAGVQLQIDMVVLDSGGRQVWAREFDPGYFAYGDRGARVASNLVLPRGIFDGTGSGAVDILVGIYNRQPTPDGPQDSMQTLVVDGADGRDASSANLDIPGSVTGLTPTGDLSGDGRDDYLIFVEDQTATTVANTLHAFTGTQSEKLWSTQQRQRSAMYTTFTDIGDATGDGTTDLVLSGALNNTQLPADLVDGRTGARVAALKADYVAAVGDLDGDSLADIGTASATPAKAQVTIGAANAAGEALFTRTYGVALRGGESAAALTGAGDVDADGVADLAYEVSSKAASGVARNADSGVVSGRTGELIRDGGMPVSTVGATHGGGTIDGSGDDAVGIDAWGDTVRDISAVDGRSGQTLWSARLRARSDLAGYTSADVADVDGDGLGDVLVTLPSYSYDVHFGLGYMLYEHAVDSFVLSGRDGGVLWQTDPPALPTPPERQVTVTSAAAGEWSGTAAAGLNQTDIDSAPCAADKVAEMCELVLLRFDNAPSAGQASRAATGVVTLSDFTPVPGPGTDLDLYVYDSDEYGTRGSLLDRSENGIDEHDERVEFDVVTTAQRPSQYVLVEVAYFQNPGSGYRGKASLVHQ